jgi:selenide,water dikinase
VLRNVGARPGDRLLLTKPLGSGIVTTAIKRGLAQPSLVERVTRLMAGLNRAAGETLAASGAVHALTDVTGFGLLGHAWEVAEGSGVALRIDAAAVPVLDGVVELAAADVVPGGSKANLAWVSPHLELAAGAALPPIVLADAQTNGGLLAAVGPGDLAAVLAALAAAGVEAAVVGEALAGPPRLEVR